MQQGSYEQPRQYSHGNSNYQPYDYQYPRKTYQDHGNEHYHRDYSNSYWYEDSSYKQQRNQNYNASNWNTDNSQWYPEDYDSGNYDSQWWGNYEMPRQRNQTWSRRKHSKPSWQLDNRQNSPWVCSPSSSWGSEGHSGSWQQYNQGDSNYWSQDYNQSGWYQDTTTYPSQGCNANLITCGTDGETQDQQEKTAGSWRDDQKMDTGENYSKKVRGRIQKKGNNQKERNRDRLSQSVDSASGKRRRNQNWEDSFSKSLKGSKIDSGLSSSTSSTKKDAKSKIKPLNVKLTTPRRKHRSGDRSFSGEPDSTTGSFVTDTTISSFSASFPLDSNSKVKLKNSGTELDQIDKLELPVSKSLISKGLKKTKTTKKAPTKVSPRLMKMSAKKSDNFDKHDKGASILQKAEKLCKELREKRQNAKSEKEKNGKMEKQKNINQHIETLSEINKSYVTGHLTAVQEKMTSHSQTHNILELRSSVSDSREHDRSSKNEIERIRQEIEKSVQEQRNLTKSSLQSPEAITQKKLETLRKSKPLKRETLLKLINSPRSRKERLKLSELLTKYSKSQNKLSMPRFNLKMSGLYDTEEMSLEEINYDDLSVDLQMQIAEMFEHDVPQELIDLSQSPKHKEIKVEHPDVIEKQTEEVDAKIKVEQQDCLTSSEQLEPVVALSPGLKLSDLSMEQDSKEIVGCAVARVESPIRITCSPKPQEPSEKSKEFSEVVTVASPSGKNTPDIGKVSECVRENISFQMSTGTEPDIPDLKTDDNVSSICCASSSEIPSDIESVKTSGVVDILEIVEVTSSDLDKHPVSKLETQALSISELVTCKFIVFYLNTGTRCRPGTNFAKSHKRKISCGCK